VADRGDAWQTLAQQLGLGVSADHARSLDAFWSLLLTWNARINLTGAGTREELIGEHLPDSLAMASLVPQGVRVLDVGSGGGLPALPFAVLRPDAAVTLVEPRAKRVAFLRTAVRELGLSVTVLPDRIEGVTVPEMDVATSRATFPPREWLERARVLAPRALVFASRRAEVGEGPGQVVEAELQYETASRHRRWLGLFRST
jgi:16S rRNA (guanine527-N7)-methyltransferase